MFNFTLGWFDWVIFKFFIFLILFSLYVACYPMKLVYWIKTEEINPKPNWTQKSMHPSSPTTSEPPNHHCVCQPNHKLNGKPRRNCCNHPIMMSYLSGLIAKMRQTKMEGAQWHWFHTWGCKLKILNVNGQPQTYSVDGILDVIVCLPP